MSKKAPVNQLQVGRIELPPTKGEDLAKIINEAERIVLLVDMVIRAHDNSDTRRVTEGCDHIKDCAKEIKKLASRK